MPLFTRAPVLRWLVPAVSAVVLLGGGWALTQLSAVAGTGLQPRSAAQLLADVQRAHLDGLSGTIVQTSDLGLPALPDTGGSGSANLSSLVTGTHTLRVWFSGPDRARISLPGNASESDVILNGTDLWTWSSQTHTATHRTVQLPRHKKEPVMPQGMTTPQAAAKAALAAIAPTTNVTTAGTARVAGRPAYELLLQPKQQESLIGRIQIGIDGATHVPTSFQVISRNGTTAFDLSFTHFDPTRPGPAAFRFNPPPHTKIVQKKAIGPDTGMPLAPSTSPESSPGLPPAAGPHVVGHGWTAVMVADLGAKALGAMEQNAGPSGGTFGRLLAAMPPAPASCSPGHAFQGTIFSAVLTNDGRLAVGPVPVKSVCAALTRAGTTP